MEPPLFYEAGDRVITHHGHRGTVTEVNKVTSPDGRVWYSASTYVICLGEIERPYIISFTDAHYTYGGLLRHLY